MKYEKESIKETARQLSTSLTEGLQSEEAERRLREEGSNRLTGGKKRSLAESFLEQLNDPLIYVLLAAAFVSMLLQEVSDALIILAVVAMNGVIGVAQEGKAQKALDALKQMASPSAIVIRDGVRQEIPAQHLVRGDLVCLEAGCQVPADLRLVRTEGLKIEEAALTGESLPAEKDAAFLAGERETAPGDRHNMAYLSTIVTAGRGSGLVTATGMRTEIGNIAFLLHQEKEELTPLQKRLGDLGRVLSALSLVLCGLLFGIALLQGRNVFDMLVTAISLAVAAVPEGLPAVVTICLALSVTRMARVHTIIRRLPSVETLGAVNVVCTDKTGTLTCNRMTVTAYFADQTLHGQDGRDASDGTMQEFLSGMVLCNDASLGAAGELGDPTELALLRFAALHGTEKERLEREAPRAGERAFDSDRKRMATFHRRNGRGVTYVKGAPDEILKRCGSVMQNGRVRELNRLDRQQIEAALREMSGGALRTLAVAAFYGGSGPVEEDLTFLGMAGMQDPPRPEAAGAVERFRQAGVTTVMITGDYVETAYAVARRLGIAERREQCMTGEEMSRMEEEQFTERLPQTRVFARISPKQKMQIVRAFQRMGGIVAMTGDGVNDAPSLKAADIGIAMGQGGTDVARGAADMVLTDDHFATIEKAIAEGRGVYENIRKSVIFLLSSNLGELMTMFLTVLCGLACPLRSSHILWINLLTDSLPALALGVDKNDADALMKRRPRGAQESLFAGGGLAKTCFYGFLIAAVSLTAYFLIPYGILHQRRIPVTMDHLKLLLENESVLARARTYAFTVLGVSQLFHAVGMRDVHRSVFRMKHRDNPLMLAALLAGFALQALVTEVPFFVRAFGTVRLGLAEWLCLIVLAAFPLLGHELFVLLEAAGEDRGGSRRRQPERQQGSAA